MQVKIGDHIRYCGYTPEAYRNGSVPTIFQDEGRVIEVESQLHILLANGCSMPVYYLDNIELISENLHTPIPMRRT